MLTLLWRNVATNGARAAVLSGVRRGRSLVRVFLRWYVTTGTIGVVIVLHLGTNLR